LVLLSIAEFCDRVPGALLNSAVPGKLVVVVKTLVRVSFVYSVGVVVPNQCLPGFSAVVKALLDPIRKLLRLWHSQHTDTEDGSILEAPFRVFQHAHVVVRCHRRLMLYTTT